METKKFKTETKRLLDLMINSIYTHKDIFLRELISNASDAIDKVHYLSLTDESIPKVDEYKIVITPNTEDRLLSIKDNGIGMTKEELVTNLGTIAKSGSLEFMEKLEASKDSLGQIDIIGQFGVGFYSSFMVAKKVTVKTHSPFSEMGYIFTSKGEDSYRIEEASDIDFGTEIILDLRDNTDDEQYDDYLEEYKIRSLVSKYSDYIRYPIKLWVSNEEPVLDSEGKETEEVTITKELETLNRMVPLWRKPKSEVTEEELSNFYKQKFNDYTDPLVAIQLNVEGALTYTGLLYIPERAPNDLYSDKYEKGVQLYTKGVFILDKCKELIPDYLRFVKGLVDSADLSLNISREMLQHDRQLVKIANNIEKKILSELSKMLRNEREKYEKFYSTYAINLKYGIYEDFGAKKDSLKDLVMYKSVNQEGYLTLAEYVEKMTENQKEIYYASGKTKEAVIALPQMDLVKKQGFDVLILSDEVDEFMISILREYSEKPFKSVNQGDLDLLDPEEKEKVDKIQEEKKDLLTALKEVLKDEVKDVVFSKRLTDSPVCLVSGEGLSLEMEKVLRNMPNNPNVKADRILEINPTHPITEAIEKAFDQDPGEGPKYAKLLYAQALLIEGIALANPIEFSQLLSELMVKSVK